ncbi:MAG: hypothetical protein IPP01_12970 [Saprospiraceae bacterium]|nr:hypothetical protein [Saprospiraceae bacterium]
MPKTIYFRQMVTDLIGLREFLHLILRPIPNYTSEILLYIEEERLGLWGTYCNDLGPLNPQKMYNNLEIKTDIRPTFYTSVHYLIKPNTNNPNPIYL